MWDVITEEETKEQLINLMSENFKDLARDLPLESIEELLYTDKYFSVKGTFREEVAEWALNDYFAQF